MKNKYNYVVYNTCFGGFGLSPEAIRLCKDAGIKVEDDDVEGMDLCRHDPRLVKIIRKLKDGANGSYAKLAIKRLKGSQYRIDDYDGNDVIEPGILEHWIVIND